MTAARSKFVFPFLVLALLAEYANADENVLEVGCLGGAYLVVNRNSQGKRIRNGLIEALIGYFPTPKHRFDIRFAWSSWEDETMTRFCMSYGLFPLGSDSGLRPYAGFGFGLQSAGVVNDNGTRNLLHSYLGLRQKIGLRGSVFLEAKSNLVFDRNSQGNQFVTTWLQVLGGFTLCLPL